MSLSKKARFEILSRDGFRCRYCGARAPEVEIVVDHIVPRAKGGSDLPDNLASACVPCNAGKADRLLSDLQGPTPQEMLSSHAFFLDVLEQLQLVLNDHASVEHVGVLPLCFQEPLVMCAWSHGRTRKQLQDRVIDAMNWLGWEPYFDVDGSTLMFSRPTTKPEAA